MEELVGNLFDPGGSVDLKIKPFSPTPPQVVCRLYALFAAVDRLFAAVHMPYWASGGTALGAVRHRGIIPWDDDLDVCLFEKDVARLTACPRDQELSDAMRRLGLNCDSALNFGARLFFDPVTGLSEPIEGAVHRFPFCDVFAVKNSAATRNSSPGVGAIHCVLAVKEARLLWPHDIYIVPAVREARLALPRVPFGPNDGVRNVEIWSELLTEENATLLELLAADGALSVPLSLCVEEYLEGLYGADWSTIAKTADYCHTKRQSTLSTQLTVEEALQICGGQKTQTSV